MSFNTLLPQTGVAGTVGASALVGSGVSVRNFQFNPQNGVGFTGTVLIEGSSAGSPGANDWVQLAEVIFSAHTQNFSINMDDDSPWVRARLTVGTDGAVAVYLSV